jgi:uroporphyrinogen decarboxylase
MNRLNLDSLTPAERTWALLAGEPTDRVQVWLWPVVPGFAVINMGYPLTTAFNDPEKAYWSQVHITDMLRSDGTPRIAPGGSYDVAWAFGAEIVWPDKEYMQAPKIAAYPASSPEKAEALTPPADIAGQGSVPILRRFAEINQEHDQPVMLWATAPVEGAASLCGADNFCRWLIRKPDLIHRLMRLCTDYIKEVVRYFTERFDPARILLFNSVPMASNQLISPRHFTEFVQPYQKEFHQSALSLGVRHIFCHICGEQNKNLPAWAEVPMGDPGIVSFGHEVDLVTAMEYFGDTCVIAGNIEPALIQVAGHEEVYEHCIRAVTKGKKTPRGFILMPGCGLPPKAPPYNVYMLKKAVADIGWY